MANLSQLQYWYSSNFESRLIGRYISLKHILPIISEYQKMGLVEVVGNSEKNENIYLIQIGKGSKKVFAWSQMHGNESTTTKAVFDFLRFLTQNSKFGPEVDKFMNMYSFYVIPMLNPDGASAYTRENANKVDLNRDAKNLTQKESIVLRKAFNAINPHLCLNLHDQRTMYSLPNGKSATVSFLSPAANKNRTITKPRDISMKVIAAINSTLQELIPGQVGRYDDSFNINCVGDSFQKEGVPTILFEAGHYPKDYQREKTREYIFYAFLSLFQLIETKKTNFTIQEYLSIPENEKSFCDVMLRNVLLKGEIVDIAIQFQEKLVDEQIRFIPTVDDISKKSSKMGHKEIDIQENEILVNSHENVFVNEEIAMISYKSLKKPIIF